MSEIQINNTKNESLKKNYEILVPYSILDQRINDRVLQMQKSYKQNGFRDGKVPLDVIKNKFAVSIMTEESQKIVDDVSKKVVEENNLRLAVPPEIEIKVFEYKKDLAYNLILEILPKIPQFELKELDVIKKAVEVTDEHIDEAIEKISKQHKDWKRQDNSYRAQNHDAVDIDYVGKIDNVEFQGGAGKGYRLELGSKSFIDNFEEQLIGKKLGDQVLVKVTFPNEYHQKEYAGKEAVFDVKINHVLCGKNSKIDDEFVKNKLGLSDLGKLREFIKGQIDENYNNMSFTLYKKELFDFCNEYFDFPLPDCLIKQSFKSLWSSVEEELKTNPEKFANDQEEKEFRSKKENIARKMVRSGLILSEISQKNKISVNDNDVILEINKKASQFPGQEKQILQYYKNNSSLMQNIKEEVLENKIVDFIIKNSCSKIENISSEELEKKLKKIQES